MDIDIDFPDRDAVLGLLQHRVARLPTGKKHNTGIYVTEVPHNPLDGVSTIDYKQAEARGYFKIDFLNVSIYKDVRDDNHLTALTKKEPIWELLLEDQFVDLLFHLSGHGDVLRKTCPISVAQLAAVLAMIRPAKRYLIGKSWTIVMNEVWAKPESGEYFFKKSHGFAYALAVVVHMNLLCEQLASNELAS